MEFRVEFQLANAIEFGLRVRGEPIVYNVEKKEISCLGKLAPLAANEDRIKLQILVDRSSIEVFGNEGVISMSTCFLPAANKNNVEFFSTGGNVQIVSLDVYYLRSAWPVD